MILALFACQSMHLPDGAEAPRPGSMEKKVVDLPEIGSATDWFTHWRDDDKLLVRMETSAGSALVVVDGEDVTTYCNSLDGGYNGPFRVGWTNDVGQWDVLDGRLYLRTEDDFIASCGTDGAVTRTDVTHTSWPQVAVMVDGGYLSWRQDGARPSFFHWDGTETEIPYDGPAPVAVAKHRDARGSWFVTDEAGTITLWDLDGDTQAITELYSADLGAARTEVWNVEPDALVIETDQGPKAASGTLGDGFHALQSFDGFSASDAYFAWADGRGFTVWGRGTSVNLAEDRTLVLGNVAMDGRHLTLEGPPEQTVVSVFDNAGDPSEAELTWDADLSTEWDWLDVASEARFEAFGFRNGVCGVARWGSWWGMDGDTVPYEVGDVGWSTADTVVYLGPCDQPGETVTRGLWNDLATMPIFGGPLKLDVPVFALYSGVHTAEGIDGSFDASLYDMGTHGYGVAKSGKIVPLFEDADAWTERRLGSTLWTLHGRTLSRVDAARQLE